MAAGLLKFIMMFVLYGMTFSLPTIGLNIYLNGMIGGVSETLSMFLIGYVLVNFRRKISLSFTGISCCLLCISFIFFTVPKYCENYDEEVNFCW